MRSAIDTNVISVFWTRQPASEVAEDMLRSAHAKGGLVICGPVYSELLAAPGVSEVMVDDFLAHTGIVIDSELGMDIWKQAGLRYSRYSRRRKHSKGGEPRRILADFIIGAHALLRADRLLTFNPVDYRIDYPELTVEDAAAETLLPATSRRTQVVERV